MTEEIFYMDSSSNFYNNKSLCENVTYVRNDSISSTDTFESVAKSEDSLMEVWIRRSISDDKLDNNKTKNIHIRKHDSIEISRSPNIADAMKIIENTRDIIKNIGINIDISKFKQM